MLNKLFAEYRDITFKLINNLSGENILKEYIERRQEILQEVVALNLDNRKVEKAYNDFGLKELDYKLKVSIEEEMKKTKEEIDKTKQKRAAYRSYSSAMRPSNLFSKKV